MEGARGRQLKGVGPVGFLVLVAWLTSCSTEVAYHLPPSSLPQPGAAPPGQTCVVKEPLADLGAPRTVVHEVAPMETIWRLSKMYGVPMENIYRANGLKPGVPIQIGQKLVIPNARTFRNIVPLYPSSRWRYVVIHHTATDIGNAVLIHTNHRNRGFWNGLGYHFLIDNGTLGKGDGQIEVSPRWIKQQDGAHCQAGGMNSMSIGVALVGNFNAEQPTPRQLHSLAVLIKSLSDYYRIPASRVLGHGDVPGANTDCPGKRFPWASLRRYLAALEDSGNSTASRRQSVADLRQGGF